MTSDRIHFDRTPITFRHQAKVERAFLPTLMLLAVLAFVLAMAGCSCVTAEADQLLKDGAAYNQGTMNDERNSAETRGVAQRNYDLLHKLRFTLDGTELPDDVAARKKARDDAKANRSE